MLGEILQDLHLTPGEEDRLGMVSLRAYERPGINLEVRAEAELGCLIPAFCRAAQHGFYTQSQFAHTKGLGNIIVGTECESRNDILISRFGGENDEGLLAAVMTDSIADGKAVEPGEHNVQDDQVIGTLQGFLQPELTVLGCIDVVSMVHEEIQEPDANGLFVFDNE